MTPWQDVVINLVNSQASCPALVSGKTFDPDVAVTSQLMMIDDPTLDEYDARVKSCSNRHVPSWESSALGRSMVSNRFWRLAATEPWKVSRSATRCRIWRSWRRRMRCS